MQIEKDVSNLTTVPFSSVQKIFSRFQDCICYNLQQSINNKEEYAEIDIYIGKLILKKEDNHIYYKFIPSPSFEKDVLITYQRGECPLIRRLEDTISDKISSAYKELL